MGDSLYERGVGGKVIPRDADALDSLCEFLQKALPSQCVAATGSDQSHGEGIRLQLVVAVRVFIPAISAVRHWRPEVIRAADQCRLREANTACALALLRAALLALVVA